MTDQEQEAKTSMGKKLANAYEIENWCTCNHRIERHKFGYEEHCLEVNCSCERFEKL